MAIPDLASIPWFVLFMGLHDSGLVPTASPSSCFTSRQALAVFWGQRCNSSYTFHNHGLPEYKTYVKDLFGRVLQLPWPLNGLLPFHFARALMVEALGLEISGAKFAFKATHPHQSRTGVPRVLEDFVNLVKILPPFSTDEER